VSHLKEREEKVCLNCNTELNGRYCHVCGQENLEPKESFWHLTTHFVYDVTHFDGKFFSTLKYLLFKPGFLPLEYSRGKRQSYLHPIRMYVFTSAIFFVIFLSFIARPGDIENNILSGNKNLNKPRQEFIDSFYAQTNRSDKESNIAALNAIGGLGGDHVYIDSTHHDSIASYRFIFIDTARHYAKTVFASKADSLKALREDKERERLAAKGHNNLVFNDEALPETVEEYDSAQAKLPSAKRDSWFGRMVNRKVIEVAEKYNEDPEGFKKEVTENFFHSIPKMMFISVPLVGLIMQLLYIRRRKQYYYVNHVIFIVFVYIETFISLLVYYGLQGLYNATAFAPFHWLAILVMVYIFLYSIVAMHRFYNQGYIKSFFKYLILLFICSILSALILGIFIITSAISV
jgi:hypothetical protein